MMNDDDMLSQEEINELLKGVSGDDDGNDSSDDGHDHVNETPKGKAENPDINDYLNAVEQDALGEIGNISFGSAATALSQLLNQKVEITTPIVTAINQELLDQEFPHPHVAIHVQYTDGFEGTNLLVIKTRDAAIIADLMLGGDGTNPDEELTDMHISAVQEAMNQMMGSASTSMSTIFNKRVDISPPGIDLLDVKEEKGTTHIPQDNILVKASFHLKVGELIDSSIMQLVTVGFAKHMVENLMNPSDEDETADDLVSDQPMNEDHQPMEEPSTPLTNEKKPLQINEEPSSFHQPERDVERSHGKQESPTSESMSLSGGNRDQHRAGQQQQYLGGHEQAMRSANVQSAAFSSFDPPQLNDTETKNLNMLLDIPLEVTVELGRTKRSIKDILEFSQGSIIELDKLAGEPVDILVNKKLIAKGEVVVIDENFGVRVTDIVSPEDRIKRLK